MTDNELLKRPIVVLGAPRSGTTLLSQLLRHHPDLYLANEPRIMWKYGNDAKSDALQPQDARPHVVAHIRRHLAMQVRQASKSRLVEKTPSNSLRVEFVERVLPDAIYVHMMREGAESVLSIRKFWEEYATGVDQIAKRVIWRRLREMRLRQVPYYAGEFYRRMAGKVVPHYVGPAVWGPRVPGIMDMARELSALEIAAWQWRMCVEHACRVGRELPADRYTECRLEDFGEEEMSRLLEFCGLSPAEEVFAAFRDKFRAKAPLARSAAADPSEVAYVSQLIAPTTAWLATLPPAARH